MANNESISVKDAVHKLQLRLLEGIQDENQLFSAGSVMSQSDYQDVVTERSIAKMCGYPLCRNSLPSEHSRRGRYRISLKEHKVYDLQETYMYCSTSCIINSRAFAGSLQEERCSVLNLAKLNEVLRLFENLNLEAKEYLGKNGDLGSSDLKIQERTDTKAGEVSLEEWIGPSNAIEGYVPQRDHSSKPARSKNHKEGIKPKHAHFSKKKDEIFSEMDFTSAIITEDGYSISKISPGPTTPPGSEKFTDLKGNASQEEKEDQFVVSEKPSVPLQSSFVSNSNGAKEGKHKNVTDHIQTSPSTSAESGKAAQSGASVIKPSLKSSGAKRITRSVTWADEKTDTACDGNLCEYRDIEETSEAPERFREMEDKKETSEPFRVKDTEDDNSVRFASAESCARALNQAAEAVASGQADVSDAVSEAGIIILPPSHDMDEMGSQDDVDVLEPEQAPLKWPRKPENSYSDLFDSEDSWYDSPPEGFSLTLSPFATMYMALFAWISSSSLAYIYGRDESFYEEYSFINGREYPWKIVSTDGRSSEIKQTLAACLARALPGLVTDLRLGTPISSLEQAMGRLLDTMSFMDPLPPFRMKHWQVIVLLFIDALSVCRIPALARDMTFSRLLLHKVLDGAQIKAEEYEVMKDFIIPLGRVPQFSTQSGG